MRDLLSLTTRTLSSGLRSKPKAMVIVNIFYGTPQPSHKACIFLKCVSWFDSGKGFSWNMANLWHQHVSSLIVYKLSDVTVTDSPHVRIH